MGTIPPAVRRLHQALEPDPGGCRPAVDVYWFAEHSCRDDGARFDDGVARAPRPEPQVRTLVHDVPYNADPDLVRPVPQAHEALRRLKEAGLTVTLPASTLAMSSRSATRSARFCAASRMN